MQWSILFTILFIFLFSSASQAGENKFIELPVPNECTLKNKVFCGSGWEGRQGPAMTILGSKIIYDNGDFKDCDIVYEDAIDQHPYTVLKCTKYYIRHNKNCEVINEEYSIGTPPDICAAYPKILGAVITGWKGEFYLFDSFVSEDHPHISFQRFFMHHDDTLPCLFHKAHMKLTIDDIPHDELPAHYNCMGGSRYTISRRVK